MKKMMLLAMLIACNWFSTNAQISFSLNIGSQPAWGPTGYDHADYYYLPDADAYYDINARVFVYREGRAWRRGASLPGRYGQIDLYHAHKVVINNDRDPWNHNDKYHNQYHSFAGHRDQEPIRDARDQKYWQNPGNKQYGQWQKQHGHDNHDNDHRNDNNGHGDDPGRHDNGHGRGH